MQLFRVGGRQYVLQRRLKVRLIPLFTIQLQCTCCFHIVAWVFAPSQELISWFFKQSKSRSNGWLRAGLSRLRVKRENSYWDLIYLCLHTPLLQIKAPFTATSFAYLLRCPKLNAHSSFRDLSCASSKLHNLSFAPCL